MTAPVTAHRPGALALQLQEVLTAAARLRTGRGGAADANSFRTQMKQLLTSADHAAKSIGYNTEDVRLAIYAVIVFIDESVLNSQQPMFAEWPSRPLQEEVFGGYEGGTAFYERLDELLRRPDSPDVSDLLEVYQLCLLLGFRGRYASAGTGEVGGLISAVGDKISRIRGGTPPLTPSWAPPAGETPPAPSDPLTRKLVWVAGGTFGFAVFLYIIFRVVLGSGVEAVRSLAM